jgi:hypothetical protein
MFLKQKKGSKNGKGHRRYQKFTASQPARSRSVLIRRSAARIWIIRVTRTRGPRNGRWSIQLTIQSSGHLWHPVAWIGQWIHGKKTCWNRTSKVHWKSIVKIYRGNMFQQIFQWQKKNILNTTASHSRHSIIHWSMESIAGCVMIWTWRRSQCRGAFSGMTGPTHRMKSTSSTS